MKLTFLKYYHKSHRFWVKHKILVILTVINLFILIGLSSVARANKSEIESYLMAKVLGLVKPVDSYHFESQSSPLNVSLQGDYINDANLFKSLTLTWPYADSRDQLDLIYNIDNFYLTLNSRQLVDYLADIPATQGEDPFVNNLFFKGESSLHLNKEFLDSLSSHAPSQEEFKEVNDFVNQQIFESLRFDGLPKLTKENNIFLVKLPLRLEYTRLNEILYPSLKNFIVSNQAILKTTLDQTKIMAYLNLSGQITKLVFNTSPLSDDQINTIFDDQEATSLLVLNEHIKDNLKNMSEDMIITIHFSKFNDPESITPPTNTINLETLFSNLSFSPVKIAETVRTNSTQKYTTNNTYKHKNPPEMIAKDFAMVHNMLYRYYNENGRYPSSLDSLANNYFPGPVPGNAETGQAFSYNTFDANQGYLLCPTATSDRSYCYKKFKLNEIN